MSSFIPISQSNIVEQFISPAPKTAKKNTKNTTFQSVQPFSSNNTLLYYEGTSTEVYYLSAFVRSKVISISGISYQQMTANLNCQLYIDISYRGLDKFKKDNLLKQGIRLSFETDESVLLTRDNADVSVYDDEFQKKIQYVIRKFVQTRIICEDLFWSPFEVIKCQIGLKINKVKLPTIESQKMCEVHFNMMDHNSISLKVKTSFDSNFGLFQIASKMLGASYSTSYAGGAEQNKAKLKPIKRNKKKIASEQSFQQLPLIKRQYGQQKLSSFNVALFQIPLYKMPSVAVVTIFLPLLALAIINLGIFYEQIDLHKRIVSISSIMVAFVALVPTIRQQIPPTPTITLVQILVFSEAITTILALFDSLRVLQLNPEGWDFDGLTSVLFIISFIVTILVNTIIGILNIGYYCFWKPSYIDLDALEAAEMKTSTKINIFEWKNEKCDAYFLRYYQQNTIQIIEDVEFNNAILAQNIFEAAILKQQGMMQQSKQELMRAKNQQFVGMRQAPAIKK